tara:strand:- start:47 stop:571 length:525 start_codon:yes stop_codon:yes gene_type:complete
MVKLDMFGLLRTTILSLALAFGTGAVLAQDFQKGLAAYKANDHATALKELRPLAEQGDADAQEMIGWIYENGIGVLQDYLEAFKWYRLAAEQGNTVTQVRLGHMYRDGRVLDNAAKAAIRAHMWYNIAAVNHTDSKFTADRRDYVAAKMTLDSILTAQSMARECMSSNYKNCGW